MGDVFTAESGRVRKLDEDRRRLLAQLATKRSSGRIRPRPAAGSTAPCSFGQRRLWFLHELEKDAPVYQISQALPIDGPLDPSVLERSLVAVVERHEALRTTFGSEHGQPVQIIAERAAPGWRCMDLSELPEEPRRTATRALAEAEARQPFDLIAGPLVRATLVRIASDSHVLLLTIHHIVADGWSMDILIRELGAVYDALSHGVSPPLSDLPIQYADYAVWQRSRLNEDRIAADLAYWQRQLAGVPRLMLPRGRSRTGGRLNEGAREFFTIDASRTQALQALAKREDATLFMTLLAAIDVLLSRFTGQDDVAVGSAVAGRSRPELEGLIGFFLNTVCLRTDVSGNPTFAELLGRVRATALGAYAHMEAPFDLVVERLSPERRQAPTALFDVMLVLQSSRARRGSTLGAPADESDEWPLESGTAKFDLTWSIAESAGRLLGALEYSTDVLDAPGARGMVSRFLRVVDAVIADPDLKIHSLPLLSDGERETLLHEWNATQAEYPSGVCVHELIASAAARTPDAVAVRSTEANLTFAELDARVTAVVRHLRSLGVCPGDRVGVRLYRTWELLAAVLGIWRAGGVYVPIDPDGPDERTSRIVLDADLRVMLEHPLKCWTNGAGEDLTDHRSRPDDLAYILYTSGSTGTPKGVMVAHRSLVNYVTWANRELLTPPAALVPAIANPSFDASLKQLFAPLVRGSCVWLVSERVVADPFELLNQLSSAGSDFTLNCVPWLWKVLLETLRSSGRPAPAGLKRLLIGGEELTAALIDLTFDRLPDVELWNLYGPTETTANATAIRVRPGERSSIGQPIANTVAFVLDAWGQLVPPGVPGELHVGGDGVALGYWGRPDLTAERFVPNPFGSGRLYKTGDLARQRDDGCFEYLGRIDRQVKLRGLRIELGEVESALERHPAIQQAAVMLEATNHVQRLTAYVEPRRGSSVSRSDLRVFARSILSDYMVPAAFVFVDALPRTVHGKIDRLALKDVAEQPPDAEPPAPYGPDEQTVAAIWSSVLRVDAVANDANFFELGGHSLLLTQVVARVREAFGVAIPLRAVFEDPTIAGFAAAIRRARVGSGPAISPIARIDRESRRTRIDGHVN